MPDTTITDTKEQTKDILQQDEKQYPEDPATPVAPDSEEKLEPASESAKNSK